jgi:acetylornithine deacetylase/succinyl-diaminopimelate desuccinylase-like protein
VIDEIFRRIDTLKGWGIDLLKDLVRLPSVSAEGKGIKETAEFIEKTLTEIGLETKMFQTQGNPAVFAEWKQDQNLPTLLIYNHYDVQPPDPLDEWISPPFDPQIREGKIFGRGASDNKGNIAARVCALKAALDVTGSLPINLKYLIEGEEEIGSPHLPEFVKNNEGMLKADVCFWESGSRNEGGQQQIILGNKGIVCADLICEGAKRDLHSSRGIMVKNPAWRLAWALASIKDVDEKIKMKGFYDDVVEPTPLELENLKKIPTFKNETLKQLGLKNFIKGLSGTDLLRRTFYEPGCNINGLTSGYQGEGSKTVLPNRASAKIDFRLVPNQKPDDIIAKLRVHLQENGFDDITLEAEHGYPAAKTSIDSPYVKLLAETGKEIYGHELVAIPIFPASSPVYLFSGKMPCPSFGVGHSDSRAHAPNESIYVSDLFLHAKHVILFMDRLAK